MNILSHTHHCPLVALERAIKGQRENGKVNNEVIGGFALQPTRGYYNIDLAYR